MIDLAWEKLHHVNVNAFQPAIDIYDDAFAGGTRFEKKKRMLVTRQFPPHFFH